MNRINNPTLTALWVLLLAVLTVLLLLEFIGDDAFADTPIHHYTPPTDFPPSGTWHRLCWDYPPCGGTPRKVTVSIGRFGEPWYPVHETYAPTRCWTFDAAMFPSGLVGIVVSAENEYGASPTEHGAYFGAGSEPLPCP